MDVLYGTFMERLRAGTSLSILFALLDDLGHHVFQIIAAESRRATHPTLNFVVRGNKPLLCFLTETSDLTQQLMVIPLVDIRPHVLMRENRERTDQAKGQGRHS